MKTDIKIFSNKEETIKALFDDFIKTIANLLKVKEQVFLAFSGGSTPIPFFKMLSEISKETINWNEIHFFWCDERCVPPESKESNYGEMNRVFLSKIDIKETNIHRIKGENDPDFEAERYSEEIKKHVPLKNELPNFDWIFLGIGEDGHTLSIFQDQLYLLNSEKIAEHSRHPETQQNRITLTGKTVNNSDRITFLVTEKSKKKATNEIFNDTPSAKYYPAWYIRPVHGNMDWYLNREVAE